MTRVLVSAWVGAGNLGDELILRATLRLLRQHDADVLVPSLDPDRTRSLHHVRSVHHLDVLRNPRAMEGADLVVFGGGGLVQDATSPWSPLYQAARPLLARWQDVPLVGLGLGAERLRLRSSRALLRAALSPATGLGARDEPSADALRALGLQGVTTTADLALTLPAPEGCAPDDTIVACLRSQPTPPGIIPSRWRRRGENEAELAAALGRALQQTSHRTGMPIRLVAMEPARDVPFAERVASVTDAVADLVAPDLDGILPELARARLVVSTRYHGAVAAAICGRPTLLLGYAAKVRALAADLGTRGRLLPNRPEALARMPQLAEELVRATPLAEAAPTALLDRAHRNGAVLAAAISRARAARSVR